MKLAKAMATVAGLTGLSRIAGFARDILTAGILGAGPIADAFFVALKLPNLFRRITAEGAFSVAFVPLYSEMMEKDGVENADKFASNSFMVMLSILSVFVLVGLIAMPWIIMAIAPGFGDDSVRYNAAVELTRITFPYLLLMSLTALLGGVLNARDRFAPFAFSPVLFNVCLIAALLLSGHFESAGHALAYGVFAAGVLQLVWLYVAARRAGVHLRFCRPKYTANIHKIFKLMGPGVVGAGVMHINLFADMIIASFLTAGSISYLYYADRLNQLPLGVVGIAVGTALLPMFSRALAKGNIKEGQRLFNRALEMCLLLALPAALALAIIPNQLISVLFQRGEFSAEDAALTALVLQSYAIGLPAYICIKVFATAHWARQDTTTPVKVSVIGTIANIALSIILVQFIGVAGIALGTGLTGWLQFALYVIILRRDKRIVFDEHFKNKVPKIIGSTVVMCAVVYGASVVLAPYIYGGALVVEVIALIALVLSGVISYAMAVHFTGALKISDLKRQLKKEQL